MDELVLTDSALIISTKRLKVNTYINDITKHEWSQRTNLAMVEDGSQLAIYFKIKLSSLVTVQKRYALFNESINLCEFILCLMSKLCLIIRPHF